MPNIDVWNRLTGQDVFLYVYVQTGVGNYAYRYRFTYGTAGLQEHSVFDTVNGIAANLNHAGVEALF